MADGYCDPTGRGETKTLESALPPLMPNGSRNGNFCDRPKDAAPSGGLGASDCGDNTGKVDRERTI